MADTTPAPLTDSEFQSLLHPTEASRATLAWFATAFGALLIVGAVAASLGTLLVVGLFFVGFVFVAQRLYWAHLMGNAVKVGPGSFPAIHADLEEARRRLAYDGKVEAFVVEEGSFDAKLARFFGKRVIILHSDVVIRTFEDDEGGAEIAWIIARFVGALKAKYRVVLLARLVDLVRPLGFLNLFVLPFERATQYSGDQVGVAVVGDVRPALQAMHRLMAGRDLGDRVSPAAVTAQGKAVRTDLFGMLARLLQTHPHMTDRYLSLLAFASAHYPEGLADFTSALPAGDARLVASVTGATIPESAAA